MGSALLRRLVGDQAQIESAGVETTAGLPATKHAVAIMQDIGIDISAHRSQDISSLDLRTFDHIIAMDPSIAAHLRRIGVGDANIAVVDVVDPYGKGVDAYRQTAKEIDRQLLRLAKRLTQNIS